MNSMPNQLLKLSWLLVMFARLTPELASPDVALPPVVFLSTVALPLCEFTLILLLMVSLFVLLTFVVALVLFWVMPPPSSAAVAPAGASIIRPTHLPSTFTNTNRLLAPTTCWPVRLKRVTFVEAFPVVALPPVVLSVTSAEPVLAVVLTLLLIAWLFV